MDFSLEILQRDNQLFHLFTPDKWTSPNLFLTVIVSAVRKFLKLYCVLMALCKTVESPVP